METKCNTCEHCGSSPLYRGGCMAVEPHHIFTEYDRQKYFIHGKVPEWCPLLVESKTTMPNGNVMTLHFTIDEEINITQQIFKSGVIKKFVIYRTDGCVIEKTLINMK